MIYRNRLVILISQIEILNKKLIFNWLFN